MTVHTQPARNDGPDNLHGSWWLLVGWWSMLGYFLYTDWHYWPTCFLMFHGFLMFSKLPCIVDNKKIVMIQRWIQYDYGLRIVNGWECLVMVFIVPAIHHRWGFMKAFINRHYCRYLQVIASIRRHQPYDYSPSSLICEPFSTILDHQLHAPLWNTKAH